MRRLLAVLAVVVVACAPAVPAEVTTSKAVPSTAPETTRPMVGAASSSTTSAAPVPSASTTAVPPSPTTSPTTSAPTTSTTTARTFPDGRYRGTVGFGDDLAADVFAPERPGAYPVAVLVHGGGWVAGDRRSLWPLAEGLAARGFVAYTPEYRTLARGGRFPVTVDDVACAVRLARRDAARFTSTPDRVVLIGHSAGAHLGALVAFGGDEFGTSCPDPGAQDVVGFVGLAGPYDIDRLELVLVPFFGTRLADDPEPWRRGNPFTYVTEDLGVPTLLVHGEADPVVPPFFSEELAGALDEAGTPVTLRLLAGVDHSTVTDPAVVGDLIADWVASLGP